MRLKTWGVTALDARIVHSAAVILCCVCVAAVGEDFLHARVSYDAGTSMVKGREDADWSYATINTIVLPGDTLWVDKEGTMELEMSGGSFLRMADGSKADVETLPPSGKIRGWSGSFYVQRIGRSTGSLELDTPVGIVDFDPNSQVRVDIVADGGTTVSVRWGHATVRCEAGGDTSLNAGQRSYVDPGYLPSEPTAFDANVEDDFDSWNRERARLLADGEQHIPRAVHIDQAPIGVADLSPYGEWVELDSAYYWRPTVVDDYVPYRNGRWSYVDGAGYCWVGGYPFSYVTTHYGRWRYTDHYGWMWTYRDTWGPAWVESVHYGPNFVWTPLDPFDRPCVAIGETFAVGSARFGFYGSSYCVADDMLMGRGYVMPMTAVVVSSVPVAEITVWNIHAGSHHGYHSDFARDSHLEVRDYAPRRVMRGFDSLASKEPAHARVASLETSFGRHEFATHLGERPKERAAAVRHEGHGAQARSVRVAADIRESAGDPRRSAALMRSPMTPEGRGKVGATETSRQSRTGRSEAEQGSRRGSEGVRTKPDTTRAGRVTDGGRNATRGERSAGPSGTEGVHTKPDATRAGRATEGGRNTTRSDRSGGPSGREAGPSQSSDRPALRSRSREGGPAPVPMRRPESAPQRGDTEKQGLPERTAPRARVDRNQGTDSAGTAPRIEGSRTRRSSSPEPMATPAPTRNEGFQTRGAETVGREPNRDVQVQRLAPLERPVGAPRQERNISPQTSPAPRIEPRPQAVEQPRQEPPRQQVPANRGTKPGERDDSNDRRKR